jgi:hypothetical protein
VLALAGCGVPASGVIDVGPAASGMPPRLPVMATVYLLHDGALLPVPRTAGPGVDPVSTALRELLAGPTAPERAKGLTTGLPQVPSAVRVETRERSVTVTLSGAAAAPGPEGLLQIACTASTAFPAAAKAALAGRAAQPPEATGGEPAPVHVTVTGQGWSRVAPADGCPPPSVWEAPTPTPPAG